MMDRQTLENIGREAHATIPLLPDEVLSVLEPQWLTDYLCARGQEILKERSDPLRYGFEPEIWKKADAKMAEFRERFPTGVLTELDLGGNRASKTERRAKRLVENMVKNAGWKAWACQSTETASIQNQQSVIYKYLPPEWKPESGRFKQGAITKINYNQASGFGDNVLVCPNGSECRFKFYAMKVTSLEGAELNEAWADELVTPDWIEALIFRLVTRNGLLGITFTPIEGYSSTVKVHLNGARVVEEVEAELLPILRPRKIESGNQEARKGKNHDKSIQSGTGILDRLGGNVDRNDNSGSDGQKRNDGVDVRDLGSDAGLDRVRDSHAEQINKSPSWIPGFQINNSSSGNDFEIIGYEKVPRVQENLSVSIQGQKSKALIFYFHTADNPYGNYPAMKATLEGATVEKIKTRAYGVPTKAMMTQFPLFNDFVHIVALNRFREIQKTGGTWYHFVDPCSGRNWFQIWVFVDKRNRAFVAGESPSHGHGWAYIPGVGDPGPWAVAGSKDDGERGDGQKEWGWGYARYIEEFARMEELLALESVRDTPIGGRDSRPTPNNIKIEARWIDARYANTPTVREERSITMIEELSELGIDFLAAPGEVSVNPSQRGGGAGLRMINDKLYYDVKRQIDATNEPHLYVVETCPNTIYALKEWTGRDGQHGASKDPVDTLRMLTLSGSEYLDEEMMKPRTPWMAQFANR